MCVTRREVSSEAAGSCFCETGLDGDVRCGKVVYRLFGWCWTAKKRSNL